VKSKPAASARLPDFVDPMKAKLVGLMPSGGDWIYEIKFDEARLGRLGVAWRGSAPNGPSRWDRARLGRRESQKCFHWKH
jgi:hypothetical protein